MDPLPIVGQFFHVINLFVQECGGYAHLQVELFGRMRGSSFDWIHSLMIGVGFIGDSRHDLVFQAQVFTLTTKQQLLVVSNNSDRNKKFTTFIAYLIVSLSVLCLCVCSYCHFVQFK